MLAIGVQGEGCLPPRVESALETQAQGRPLSLVRGLAEDRCAGRLGDRRRLIGRAIVDDEDRQVCARGADDGRDPRRLVVGRDQRVDPLEAQRSIRSAVVSWRW